MVDVLSSDTLGTTLDNPVLELPDGSRQLLSFTGKVSPLMLTAQRWRADCIDGWKGLAVYSPDGTRYDMNQTVSAGGYAWHPTKITDKNGNYITIAYVEPYKQDISSVTTSDGRSVSFTYCTADPLQSTRRICEIKSGQQVYTYDYVKVVNTTEAYLLTSVTRPDGRQWKYSYNGDTQPLPGGYAMKQTIHPLGGIVDYGYGFVEFDPLAHPYYKSTVVNKKTTSSEGIAPFVGGNWTFNYSPGSNQGDWDTSTVTTPSGIETYKHCGPKCASNETVWKIGLLMSKTMGSVQTENYSWTPQKISSEQYVRPGVFVTKYDTVTNAPLLAKHSITRDGATYTTSYSSFDEYGNPRQKDEFCTSGGMRTTLLTYANKTSKWIVHQVKDESVSGGGASVGRIFDSWGNLTSVTRDGVTTSYDYDGEGNVKSATFPRTPAHTYYSYKRGIAQDERQPEGVNIGRVVSDAGNVTSETNGQLYTTAFTYDNLNRVTAINYPIGSPVNISYPNSFSNAKTAKRGGLEEKTDYNGFGQPTRVTLGGIVRNYTVDALGRNTFVSDPGASSGTGYAYDILNRVTRITHADNSKSDIDYGAGSKTVADERNKSTTYTYRAYGNPDQQFLMGIAAADSSASITITRNGHDLVTSVTQGGVARGYGYNGNYYLSSVTNPETGTTTYGRDAAGNMTTRTAGASGTTGYTYDGQNRLKNVNYPGTTPSVTNWYNGLHKLVGANSSTGNRAFGYDANGNLISESLAVDGQTFTASYGYNGLDQLESTTYPRSGSSSGSTVSYSPDVLGRPTKVSGYIDRVTYWPSGQIHYIDYANGTTSSYEQNIRLWPSSFSTGRGALDYIYSNYFYDGVGNLTSIDSGDASYDRMLGYDNINRLNSISGPWGTGSTWSSGFINYDGAGNITSQVFGNSSLNYNYDSSNKLSSVSGARSAAYGYDAYGDVVSATGTTYTYDGVPNLRCVNCSDPANKIEYSYDATNHRSMVSKGGVKTYEMYGSTGNQLIEFTPSQNYKLVQYFYLGGKRIAQRISH